MHARGFTLMELVVTIAIAAILVAVAIPSFRVFNANAARREAATSLYSALQRARSEALARNQEVRVCAQAPATAEPACGGIDFDKGWVVVAASPTTSTDEVLQAHGPINETAAGITGEPGVAVTFLSTGRSTASVAFLVASKVTVTADIARSRCLRVALSGSVTLAEVVEGEACAA